MKTLTTLILFFVMTDLINAQKIIGNTNIKLTDFQSVLEQEALNKTKWSFKVHNIKNESDIADSVNNFLSMPVKDGFNLVEFNLLKKYENKFQKLLPELLVKNNSINEIITSTIPFRIVNKNRELALLTTTLSIDNVVNTLKYPTSEDRVPFMISSKILQILLNIYEQFKDTDIKNFGVVIIYGYQNFSEVQKSSPKPELVSVLASKKNIKEFIDGKINSNKLIQNSDIYLSNIELNETINKINVSNNINYQINIDEKNKWQTVYTFSGSSNETTDDFTIKSNKWRIVWEANKQYADVEGGNLAIYLVYPNGDEDFIANTLPYNSGKSIIRKKGTFYFRITCFFVNWKIEVQEYVTK